MDFKRLTSPHIPFWIIAFSLLIGLTAPILIQDGMFMDAVLYTSVSHNLSQGIGTFWFPQFSLHNVAGLSSFHEQPPLVFGIQSLFFKILGDSLYVERFYTFLTLCCNAALIVALWKEIFRKEERVQQTGWLPIALWISVPVCFWSFSNNMHENTMSIFTLCAVLFIYKSFSKDYFSISLLLIAGVFIFLASFSKGIPGLFPITLPLLHCLILKKVSFKKAILTSLLISIVPIFIYFLLFLFPESRESLSIYFFKRVLHRINEVPTVENRFYIFGRLFMELLPSILLCAIILIVEKFKKQKTPFTQNKREAIFFLTIGFTASAPLALTLVQKGFYFVPSLPYFAIGFAIFISPYVTRLVQNNATKKRRFNLLFAFSAILFLATLTFTFFQKGKASRNQEMLHDIYLIGKNVPNKSVVSVSPEMWNHWDLQCYLMRYCNISVEANNANTHFIVDKNLHLAIPLGYHKVPIETLQFDLYERNEK